MTYRLRSNAKLVNTNGAWLTRSPSCAVDYLVWSGSDVEGFGEVEGLQNCQFQS